MTQRIALNHGKHTIVDDDVYTLVAHRRWYANKRGNNFYALSNMKMNTNKQPVMMHRLIIGAQPGQRVDHVNGDTLDNRLSNLRFCTHAENMKNLAPRINCSSVYRGVSQVSRAGGSCKWAATITSDKQNYYLGVFDSEMEAARAYDKAARKLHGDFARPNLP